MKEGTNMRDHLDGLNSILLELHDIDVKMDDEDLALILLAFYHHHMKTLLVHSVLGR